MPTKKQTRINQALQGRSPKKKEAAQTPQTVTVMVPDGDLMREVTEKFAEMERERNEGMKELLESLLEKESSVKVEIDIEQLSEAVAAKLPAPVVNVAPREPRSYRMKVERSPMGNLSGATIEPI